MKIFSKSFNLKIALQLLWAHSFVHCQERDTVKVLPAYCNVLGSSAVFPECRATTITTTIVTTISTTAASTTTTRSPASTQSPTEGTFTESPGEVECDPIGRKRVVEGDMVYFVSPSNNTRAGATFKSGHGGTNFIWPNNQVIFAVDRRLADQPDRLRKIYRAMIDVQNAIPNCITFRQYRQGDRHYTTLQSHNEGCYSTVGYYHVQRRNQVINFNRNCPSGSMVHELLHTLGFFHEHTRNDRDDYVLVDESNIKPDYRRQYAKDASLGWETSYYNVGYNYESIMHYPLFGNSFAIDESKQVMYTRRNPNGEGSDRGISRQANRSFLSRGDLLMIANRHSCPPPNRQTYPVTGASESDTLEHEVAPPVTEEVECP